MFSFLAAIISLATLIDVYKVAKEWYINTIKSHDEISALINENRQNQIDIHKTEHSILELNDYSRKIVNNFLFQFDRSTAWFTNTREFFPLYKHNQAVQNNKKR